MRLSSLRWISAAITVQVVAMTVGAAEHHAIGRRPAEFRVDSELVVLPLSITDRAGRTVLGLMVGDFMVAEDGVPQQVLGVSRWDAPASIGVVFDTSGSMKVGIRSAQSAVRCLLDESGDRDEAFLISFSDTPRLEVTFTSDAHEIPDKLIGARPRGATALLDAIYAAITKMKQAANARRALVVITDGGDNHSRHSFRELVSVARESDVQIFAIAIRRNVRDLDEQRGRLQLDQLANETGGHLLIADSSAQLPQATAEVNNLIRNQYLLSYRPAKLPLDGKWHRVQVRLQSASKRSLYTIYSKNGYYAPEP